MKNLIKSIVFLILAITCYIQCSNKKKYSGDFELKKIYDIDISENAKKMETVSACVDEFGSVHAVLNESGYYLRIAKDGKIIDKRNIRGSDLNQFDSPNYIQSYNKNIIISDIKRREIKFLDYDLNYVKSYRLSRFPLKFRVVKNEIYYMCDFLETNPIAGKFYSYRVFKQNLQTKKEEEVFAGYQINVDTLIKKLDFDNPGTIDFDLNIKDKSINCIRQQTAQYLIYKISLKDFGEESVIKLDDWKPISYQDSEKERKIDELYSIISKTSKYPKENIYLDKKLAITTIGVDTYGNIWASSATEFPDTIKINIFSDEGELLKELNISGFSEIGFSFNNDFVLLYEIDPIAKMRMCLYQY